MRVLELAQIMAGPTAGMMLADMGADVIKVEKLPGGDDSRGYREPRINGVSAPFLIMNRNKRGIALNLKHPQGREILLKMVRDADVLLENYRTGTMEKMGLGYDVLSSVNPGLIYCAVTGFGRDGPWADKGGFDLIAQGFAGLMSITGEPGGAPAKNGNPVSDISAGNLAVVGILAAYIHKLKTGRGQVVDTSLMEAAVQQTYWHAAVYFPTGQSPGPTGSAHVLGAPYQAFRAKDGWLNIGGANQSNWERIAEVLGHPEWRDDPRFATNSDRMANLDALVEKMNAVARHAQQGRMDRRLRCGRRASRRRPQHRRGAVAPPDASARHGGRSRPPTGRRDEGHRLPRAFLRDTDRNHATGPAARRTHAQPAARIRLQRCRDRRIHRRRGGRGRGVKRSPALAAAARWRRRPVQWWRLAHGGLRGCRDDLALISPSGAPGH